MMTEDVDLGSKQAMVELVGNELFLPIGILPVFKKMAGMMDTLEEKKENSLTSDFMTSIQLSVKINNSSLSLTKYRHTTVEIRPKQIQVFHFLSF